MPDLRWIKALSQQVCKLVWWRQGFNKHLGASHRRSEAILYVLMKTQIEEEVCISNCSRLVAEPGGEWGKSNFLSILFFFSSSNYFSNVLEPVLIYECFSEAAYSSVQVIVALVLSMKVDKNIGNDIWEQADVHLGPGFSRWKCSRRCYLGRTKSGHLRNGKHRAVGKQEKLKKN